ncbi:MAG: hypothetical protein NUV86_12140 [Candidatus Scalindua sp.]|nr:hypothetical protein [Candidatus Scalindua sp.]MCR4343854.1 hypothetical protein [Candidatus Scalindua sp.]
MGINTQCRGFKVLSLRGVKNMQDKKHKYISCLVPVLSATFLTIFLLKVGINNINAEEGPLTTPLSTQYELNEGVDGSNQSIPIKASLLDVPDIGEYQSTLELTWRLAGTVMAGNENAYALIVEETTGKQNLYSVGESIKGAEILKIDKDSVVIEREGKFFVLRVGCVANSENSLSETHTENGSLFTCVSEELPFFEPVFNKTGPPVDENVLVEKLPPFVPITNSTGPPIDPDLLNKDLPEFVPMDSDSGPP